MCWRTAFFDKREISLLSTSPTLGMDKPWLLGMFPRYFARYSPGFIKTSAGLSGEAGKLLSFRHGNKRLREPPFKQPYS